MKNVMLSGTAPGMNGIARFVEMNKKVIIEIISVLLILLFAYTATSKLITIERFKIVLKSFPTIGSYATFIAYAIPIIELVTSALLVLPQVRKVGFYFSFSLMLFFTLYLGYMVAFTTDATRPCECGGVLRQMSWPQHLVFNIFFTGLALLGLVLIRKKSKD
jgi:putative oxidoreductase